jgi:hypothetical protein
MLPEHAIVEAERPGGVGHRSRMLSCAPDGP